MPINERILISLNLQDNLTSQFSNVISKLNRDLSNIKNISKQIDLPELDDPLKSMGSSMKELTSIQKDMSKTGKDLDLGFGEQTKELVSVQKELDNVKKAYDNLNKNSQKRAESQNTFDKYVKKDRDTVNNKDILPFYSKYKDIYSDEEWNKLFDANKDNSSYGKRDVFLPETASGYINRKNNLIHNGESWKSFLNTDKLYGFEEVDTPRLYGDLLHGRTSFTKEELNESVKQYPNSFENPLLNDYINVRNDKGEINSTFGLSNKEGSFDKEFVKDLWTKDDWLEERAKNYHTYTNKDLAEIDKAHGIDPKKEGLPYTEEDQLNRIKELAKEHSAYRKSIEETPAPTKSTSVSDSVSEATNKLSDFKDTLSEVANIKPSIDNSSLKETGKALEEATNVKTDTLKDTQKILNQTTQASEKLNKTYSDNIKSPEFVKEKGKVKEMYKDDGSLKQFGNMMIKVDDSVKNTSTSFDVLATRGSRAGKNINAQLGTLENSFASLKGTFTGFLGLLGMGSLFSEIWSATTMRESNKIMLSQKRSAEEVGKLYDTIQQKVLELPGDDTFFTNLLTMASTMDSNMNIQQVDDLGDTIADYYALAKAKGENDYETQKDIRSYLLSGNTRNFLNSALSTEIQLLKNKKSITERSIALEKAMQNVNMDGMAHYKSLTNALEEFKGHFQKAFADVGDSGLWIVKAFLQVYNAVDSFMGTGITQFIITLGVGLIGLVGGTFAFKKGLELTTESINSLVKLSTSLSSFVAQISASGGAINSLKTSINELIMTSSLADSNGLLSPFLNFIGVSRTSEQQVTRFKKELMDLGNVSANSLQGAEASLMREMAFGQNSYTGEDGSIKTIAQPIDMNDVDHRAKLGARAMVLEDLANDESFRYASEEEQALIRKQKQIQYEEKLNGQLVASENLRNKSLIERGRYIVQEEVQSLKATKAHLKEIGVNLKGQLNDVRSALAKDNLTRATELETLATEGNTFAKIANWGISVKKQAIDFVSALIKTDEASAVSLETLAEEGNTFAKIANFGVSKSKLIVDGLLIIYTNLKALATDRDTLATIINTDSNVLGMEALFGNAVAENAVKVSKEASIAVKIYGTLLTIKDTAQNWLNTASTQVNAYTKLTSAEKDMLSASAKGELTLAHWLNTDAIVSENIAEETNIFVKIKNTVESFSNAIAHGLEAVTKKINAISTVEETIAVDMNTSGKILNTLADVGNIAKTVIKIALRVIEIPLTVALSVAEGVLTSELLAQAGAFMIATAPVWVLIGAIVGLIVVIEKIGEAFGWWSDFSSMLDAMWSGIMRIWDAFMNSAPIKSITNFIYTLETAINGIVQVLGVFWDLLFPSNEGSGEWDIVGDIINFLSIIGNVVYYASGLFIIFNILDAIGGAIGMMIDAWNLFLDSPLATEMFTALGEAFDELKAPFQEISQAFGEVFDAFGEIWEAIFGPSEDGEKQFNPFIELIKGFAQFIINYVVPAIKVIATIIRVLLIPLRVVAFVLQSIAGIIGMIIGATQTGAGIINNAINSIWQFLKPVYDAIKWIVDSASGVWEFLTGTKADGGKEDKTKSNNKPNPKSPKNLPTGNLSEDRVNQMKQQTQRNRTASWLGSTYHNQSNNSHTIVNNNFGDGSIPIDARNMTQKEAERTIQSGLGGYLNARRVTNK